MANIIEINDLSTPGVEMFARLTEAQLRNRLEPEKGIFIAETTKVVRTALDAGYEPIAMLAERKNIKGLACELMERCGDIPLFTADDDVLTGITGYEVTKGILCAFHRPKPLDAEEICRGKKRIVVLETIANATNTGAIFRAAAALNMDAVLLSPTCCDPLNRRSVRVSMGTVFQIPWAYLGSEHTQWPHPGMERLHEMGFKTAAMALNDNSVSIDDPALLAEDRLAIIMGTEGDGLQQETIRCSDYVVKIPMYNGVDSLNVAAASAVAFWQLHK